VTAVLAIDAGKSGCRAARFVDGTRGSTASGPGIENVAKPGALTQIRDALTTTLAGLPDTDRPAAVCMGLTGVLEPGSHARAVAELLHELVPVTRRVVVTSDVVTSFCGALGLRPGVVVAAGTGAITLAASPAGALARVDGWGYLLDDAGSAFELGRAGLREALRAADGRGGSPALHAAALATFGDLVGLTDRVYGAQNPARTIAAFAMQVSDAADAGDPVASRLLGDAGRELARSAVAAASRVLDVGTSVAVSWHGGVFDAGPALLEPFLTDLRAAIPTADPHPPRGDGLDGAAALAAAAGPTVVDRLLTTSERVDA
jgi:glucosamine kinase